MCKSLKNARKAKNKWCIIININCRRIKKIIIASLKLTIRDYKWKNKYRRIINKNGNRKIIITLIVKIKLTIRNYKLIK